MNDLTRKGANALVAAVDFLSGALAEEARAGEEKQRQLDALAAQLKTYSEGSKHEREEIAASRKDLDDALALHSLCREQYEREIAGLKAEVERLTKLALHDSTS